MATVTALWKNQLERKNFTLFTEQMSFRNVGVLVNETSDEINPIKNEAGKTNRNLSLHLRIRLQMRCYIFSVFLYGCDNWANKIVAFLLKINNEGCFF